MAVPLLEWHDEVSVRKDENGYSVVAESPEIAFLEFGAGYGVVEIGDDDKVAKTAAGVIPIEVGSWSREHGGEFYQTSHPNGEAQDNGKGHWHYNGDEYTRIDARQGMELAREHIVDNAEKKLKEVFSGD